MLGKIRRKEALSLIAKCQFEALRTTLMLLACSLLVNIIFISNESYGQEISFNRDIRPILADRCFACHGPDSHERKGKLRLDQATGKDGAYRTHKDVTAIKPGSLEDSEFWYRITTDDRGDVMPPPKSNIKPLSDQQKLLIKKWIEAGAPYEDFWAFVPPQMPELPKLKDEKWGSNKIDRFSLSLLEKAKRQPAPTADKRTLIRRLTFDLTGLPPTRKEIHEFLKDKRPEAYKALVDRLLEKPQYGEHMARYWLDLVRFADTNGMHKDFYRNFIAYRDWVIRSFNDNLSYDDFLRYQIAGDLYPDANDDQLVASGFNRLHLIIDRGTALPEESFYKNVVDRVTAVGTAFMGLTVHCSSCHDHKYDPLTKKDFYSLYAFFNNIDAKPETAGRPREGLQPPFITIGDKEVKEKLNEVNAQLKKLEPEVNKAKKVATDEKDPEKKKPLMAAAKELVAQKNKLNRLKRDLEPKLMKAMVYRERKEVRQAHIMRRGQYDDPGEPVQRNSPEFLFPMEKKGEVASRMDLANWFVDKRNPLTARVQVNRLWQQFFGVGLVKTSEDLGSQGEVPSHPKLLDYLAVSYMDSGWDTKALVKQIVMSSTYRQSSLATSDDFKTDPDNRMLSRATRFRMDAEMIRDQILATSGLLSMKMYGRSVKPPQPDGLWKAVTMIGERFRPDKGDDIYRRSLYTYWKRGMPPPQMTILNAPIRDACTARRERTNTPSQALLLLNESEYLNAARHLAIHTLKQKDKTEAKLLEIVYETITSKIPDQEEQKILEGLLKDLKKSYQENPKLAEALCAGLDLSSSEKRAKLAAWTVVVNTLFNMDITKTRE